MTTMAMTMAADNEDNEVDGDGATSNDDGDGATGDDNDGDGAMGDGATGNDNDDDCDKRRRRR